MADDKDADGKVALGGIRQKKKCSSYFLFNPEGRFLTTWDSSMLAVIAYSCFTAAYYTAFDFDSSDVLSPLVVVEHVVHLAFWTDIILNFLRMVPAQDGVLIQSHSTLARK